MPLSEPSSMRKRPFKFLQANLNGVRNAQRALLEHGLSKDKWDLILIQEAARGTASIGAESYGYVLIRSSRLREQPGRNISTCVYARKDSDLGIPSYVPLEDDECTCSGEARESHIEHICTVVYDLPDGDRLYATNIYNRKSDKLSEDCLTTHLQYDGHLFLAGDFNMHDLDWERGLRKPNSRPEPLTQRFKEQVRVRGLRLLTQTGGEPTWRNGYRFSIIDLTMASPELSCSAAKLRQDLKMAGVDHVSIETTGQVMTDPRPIRTLDWKNADIAGIEQATTNFIQSVQPLPLDTVEQVRRRSRDLMAAFKSIVATFVPVVPRSPFLRFKIDTPEINELTTRVEAARVESDEAHRKSRNMHASLNHDNNFRTAVFAPYHAREREWLRMSKDLDKLRDIEFNRQWRTSYSGICKWSWYRYTKRKGKPRAPVNVPHFRVLDRHGNFVGRTTSAYQKVLTLHRKWHGKLRREDRNEEPTVRIPETPESSTPSSPSQKVSVDDLTMIVNKLKPGTSAGYDEIGPRFIIEFSPLFIEYLARLWSACLRLAYFPDVFKIGRTIPIPKVLGFGALFDLPNHFRPICLLSSIGKTLESYLANVLAEYAQLHNLLPATQYAARGRSINHALLYLNGLIERAARKGLAISVMCMDQAGAFNAVLFRELLRVFRSMQIPEWIIAMVSSYLCGRWTTVRIPGFESEPMRCGGVPQGSPLSPILFAFFTSRLLEVEEVPGDEGRVFKFAFSDDTYFMVIGTSMKEIKPELARQNQACQRWAKESGASFNPAKTKVIHFASPAQNDAPPMSHYIPGFDDKLEFDCTTTGKDDYMTILGVRFAVNSRGFATWDSQWAWVVEQYASLTKDFSRIVKSTYGLSVVESSQVSKAGARASIMTGSVIWMQYADNPWFLQKPSDRTTADSDDTKTYADANPSMPYFTPNKVRARRQALFQKMGNKFQRMALGSFTRAPRWYLRAELGEEPWDLFAFRSNLTLLANIMSTPEWDTIDSARNRVEEYAQKVYHTDVQELRGGRVRDFLSPSQLMEQRAAEWRQAAMRYIEEEDEQEGATIPDDGIEGPLSQDGVAALDEFRRTMGDLPDAEDDSDQPIDSTAQRLKLRLKVTSKKFSHRVVKSHFNHWRQRKYDALVKNDPKRIIPPALRQKWNGQGLKRYRGLKRPYDSLLFALRSEYIGLLHHRRELCGSKMDDSYCRRCRHIKGRYETITHLLHYCPTLEMEREALYDEVFATVPSIKSKADMRRDIIVKAPALVVKFALAHFPIDQLEWTRTHLMDLLNQEENDE